MGLFQRLIGSSPERQLAKAARHLENGRPAEALDLARRAARETGAHEAEQMVETARRGLVAHALEQAERAESSEYFEDAAEWLQTARQECDPDQREELESRITELRSQAADAETWEDLLDEAEGGETGAEAGGEFSPEDLDNRFEALLGILEDPVADRYRDLGDEFRSAVLAVEEGRGELAIEQLEPLLARHADDPVLQLTRGRALLQTGDADTAQQALDLAWRGLGSEPLDRSGLFSVPALWAEATLARQRPEEVVERAGDLAVATVDSPEGRDHPLVQLVIEALLGLERFEEAKDLAQIAARRFSSESEFSRLLAMSLYRLGGRNEAIGVLEQAIAPSCASGSCSRPPVHLASIRTLASLYLDPDFEPSSDGPRVEELVGILARTQGGRLTPADGPILERWKQLQEAG